MPAIGRAIKATEGKQGGGALGGIIGTVLGGGAGFLLGGPPGALAGASLGGSLGSTAGALANQAQAPTQSEAAGVNTDPNAVARRLQQLNEDPVNSLQQSITALQTAPQQIRQEYAEPLLSAYQIALKQRQGGGQNA